MNLLSKIYVAGHRGMVGSAIVRKLKKDGYKNLIYADKAKLDLTNLMEVQTFIKSERL
jgi:GDP-L-fucose synthase